MIFQFRKQVQRLQAIDPERLEKIFVGRQFFARHLEMGRRELKDFVERLSVSAHILMAFHPKVLTEEKKANTAEKSPRANLSYSGQVRLRGRALPRTSQSGLHRGPGDDRQKISISRRIPHVGSV